MQLIGQKVEHASYGQGEIVSYEEQRVEVRFAEGEEPKKFLYPDAFEKFLSMTDKEYQQLVEKEVKQMHETRVEVKEEIERQRVEEKEAVEAAKKAKKSPARKPRATTKAAAKSKDA